MQPGFGGSPLQHVTDQGPHSDQSDGANITSDAGLLATKVECPPLTNFVD